MMKTKAFVPSFGTPFQRRLDSAIGTLFPSLGQKRMLARAATERLQLSYEAARSGRERPPAESLRGPDNIAHQYDSVRLIQRAEEMVRDSSFFGSIRQKFQNYVIGNLQYIPNVGDEATNEKYRRFFNDDWMPNSDSTGRFHFVDQVGFALTGAMAHGDHGFVHQHRDDGSFQIQNIEGVNIGNPRCLTMNPDIIRGVVIRDGVPVAYQIFRQTITGMFQFEAEIPAEIFTHYNPVEWSDEYKAKTPFHAVLGDVYDVKDIEKAWKMKIKSAGYKTALVNTSNGAFPLGETSIDRGAGNTLTGGRLKMMEPGEELYSDPGTIISMIENNTPTQNEQDLIETKLAQIALALDMPLAFVWVSVGLPGTMTRLISKQAERTFQNGRFGQTKINRDVLTPIKNAALMSGIVTGAIPWVANWNRGTFLFPPHPSTDEGNESDSDLKENAQGVLSMAEICGKRGVYWRDTAQQIKHEAKQTISDAIEIAKQITAETGVPVTWQDTITHIQMMGPNPKATTEGENATGAEASPGAQGAAYA
jgi:Phage portal protein, lambda family